MLTQLKQLSEHINSVDTQGQMGEHNRQMLQQLVQDIEAAQSCLARPELRWMTNETFDLGDKFERMLTVIHDSHLLGPEVSISLKVEGEKLWHNLKENLAKQQTSLTGPLLQRENGKVLMQLSNRAVALKDAAAPIPLPEPCARWVRQLEEAVQRATQYNTLLDKGLKDFFVRQLVNLVDQALQEQQSMPSRGLGFHQGCIDNGKRGLDTRIALFQKTTSHVQQLSDIVEQWVLQGHLDLLVYQDTFRKLNMLVGAEALKLLEAVEALHANERFYTVKGGNFSWWDGEPPLAFQAFDVPNAMRLDRYLASQRKRMTVLANQYAKPLVTFLSGLAQQGFAFADPFPKWHQVMDELEAYAQQQPGSALAGLEDFIRQMNDFSTTHCPASTDAPPVGDSFFLQKHAELQQQIGKRCQELERQTVANLYAAVAAQFNKNLAGRFPFTDETDALGAAPTDISSFYRVFDASVQKTKDLLKRSTQFGEARKHALTFLENMEKVREFLALLVDGIADGDAPGITFAIDLRVVDFASSLNGKSTNRAPYLLDGEKNIAARWLRVGDQVLEYRGSAAPLQGYWRYDDPLWLSLRWATGTPLGPLKDGASNHAKIAPDKTITYEDTQAWSLLRLLHRYRMQPDDHQWLVKRQPHTLVFIIPTGSWEAEANGSPPEASRPGTTADSERVKVFMRVHLASADTKKKWTLWAPQQEWLFPTQAPALTSSPSS